MVSLFPAVIVLSVYGPVQSLVVTVKVNSGGVDVFLGHPDRTKIKLRVSFKTSGH